MPTDTVAELPRIDLSQISLNDLKKILIAKARVITGLERRRKALLLQLAEVDRRIHIETGSRVASSTDDASSVVARRSSGRGYADLRQLVLQWHKEGTIEFAAAALPGEHGTRKSLLSFCGYETGRGYLRRVSPGTFSLTPKGCKYYAQIASKAD